MSSKKKILVFEHMPAQNPGLFRRYTDSLDIEFIEVDLHAGDSIPDIGNFDGLWVMGGSMNIWEEETYPWLVTEKQIIRRAIDHHKIPFLGICLGHQLLAASAGGEARLSDNEEIGLFEIRPTMEGSDHPLLHNIPNPFKWVNVHRVEVTKPPPGAIILASSKNCKNHIMQVRENAFSCQFHPEVCEHTVEGWLNIPGVQERLEESLGSNGLDDFRQDINSHLSAHNETALQLIKNWIKIVFNQKRYN